VTRYDEIEAYLQEFTELNVELHAVTSLSSKSEPQTMSEGGGSYSGLLDDEMLVICHNINIISSIIDQLMSMD
jgi:hypothetical protein